MKVAVFGSTQQQVSDFLDLDRVQQTFPVPLNCSKGLGLLCLCLWLCLCSSGFWRTAVGFNWPGVVVLGHTVIVVIAVFSISAVPRASVCVVSALLHVYASWPPSPESCPLSSSSSSSFLCESHHFRTSCANSQQGKPDKIFVNALDTYLTP